MHLREVRAVLFLSKSDKNCITKKWLQAKGNFLIVSCIIQAEVSRLLSAILAGRFRLLKHLVSF